MEIKARAFPTANTAIANPGRTPMNACDVMVSNVITVGADASVQEVAHLLLTHRISAVPVVNEQNELLGIVSEGDLLHRIEAGTERRRSWWLDLLASREILADDFTRSHSRHVTDVMTRRLITVAPSTPLGEVAAILEKNGIKRVPVVQDGKVVGIVSRANLLQALATLGKTAPSATTDDGSLRDRILAQLQKTAWARPGLLNIIVHDGTVELWGMVDSVEEKKAVRVVAEMTPGVRAVNDNLTIYPVMAAG
jgi:CBS domain-containing protein